MRVDKMTTRFQQALAEAQSLALAQDNQLIEPIHLLASLLDQDQSTVRQVLARANVDANRLRQELTRAVERLPKVQGAPGQVAPSNDLVRLLNVTEKLATQRGDAYIPSELFVLAAVGDDGELGRLLKAAGARAKNLLQAIDGLRGS